MNPHFVGNSINAVHQFFTRPTPKGRASTSTSSIVCCENAFAHRARLCAFFEGTGVLTGIFGYGKTALRGAFQYEISGAESLTLLEHPRGRWEILEDYPF
jgi:hypothetical protein